MTDLLEILELFLRRLADKLRRLYRRMPQI